MTVADSTGSAPATTATSNSGGGESARTNIASARIAARNRSDAEPGETRQRIRAPSREDLVRELTGGKPAEESPEVDDDDVEEAQDDDDGLDTEASDEDTESDEVDAKADEDEPEDDEAEGSDDDEEEVAAEKEEKAIDEKDVVKHPKFAALAKAYTALQKNAVAADADLKKSHSREMELESFAEELVEDYEELCGVLKDLGYRFKPEQVELKKYKRQVAAMERAQKMASDQTAAIEAHRREAARAKIRAELEAISTVNEIDHERFLAVLTHEHAIAKIEKRKPASPSDVAKKMAANNKRAKNKIGKDDTRELRRQQREQEREEEEAGGEDVAPRPIPRSSIRGRGPRRFPLTRAGNVAFLKAQGKASGAG